MDSYDKLARIVMGFDVIAGADAPGQGELTLDALSEAYLMVGDRKIGRVTSLGFSEPATVESPVGVGLAVCERVAGGDGSACTLYLKGKTWPAVLRDRPFWVE